MAAERPRDVEALEELVEIAVLLKDTGLLDFLRIVAEKAHEILQLVSNDKGVARAAGLLYAVQAGLERPGPDEFREARLLLEEATACTLEAAAKTRREDLKPIGTLGLLSALRDRRVQVGLSLLLSLARGLGECLEKRRGVESPSTKRSS